jgi:lipocalin
MKRINFVATLICIFTSCTPLQKINDETVESLDLNRYLGEWYEIARFDHIFERDMDYNKAVYALREDGFVSVTTSGMKNGKIKKVTGVAKTTDNPALLRVSFFKPFYADYRIFYIDADYQYALVGCGKSDYLWMLSRTPQLDDNAKNILLKEASRRGFNTDKFIWVRQTEEEK